MSTLYHRTVVGTLLCIGGLALAITPALALDPYDPPVITCESSTLNSITLHICAGASGAPAGVTIQWKKCSDYAISGWDDDGTLCKLSLSGQPSLQHPDKSRWELLSGECEDLEIGDINFDETGVSGSGCGLDALECGTCYVFRSFAHAGRGFGRSDFTSNVECNTAACPPSQCTRTQGYWKTHGPTGCVTGQNSNEWPASVNSGGLTLGSVNYTAAQLCCIFQKSAGGNGLVALAHQLIAAKINVANGANNCPGLQAAIAAADALIGNLVVPSNPTACTGGVGSLAPASTSGLTTTLDLYNNGGTELCSPNCHADARTPDSGKSTPAHKSTWGALKTIYR